jgi:hypothetical protein
MGHKCLRVEQDETAVMAFFQGAQRPPRRGLVAIG